ncbi:MAG TPA: hypothetical protein VM491_21160 [Burkholderiaceae bacterium]|nr:hypothetical protein [Burkholderiaceae bacterium]
MIHTEPGRGGSIGGCVAFAMQPCYGTLPRGRRTSVTGTGNTGQPTVSAAGNTAASPEGGGRAACAASRPAGARAPALAYHWLVCPEMHRMSLLARLTGDSAEATATARPGVAQTCATLIVQQYAEAMRRGPPAGQVASDTELPYGKEEIGAALLLLLRATEDPRVADLLRSAFVRLADWQSGVGDNDAELRLARAQTERRRRAVELQRLDGRSGT